MHRVGDCLSGESRGNSTPAQVAPTKFHRPARFIFELGQYRVPRLLAIAAGIFVARGLKTTDDLFDCRSSPRTESLVAAAVQWADPIMRKIDNVFSG